MSIAPAKEKGHPNDPRLMQLRTHNHPRRTSHTREETRTTAGQWLGVRDTDVASSYKLSQRTNLSLQWDTHTQCLEPLRLMTIRGTNRYPLRRNLSIAEDETPQNGYIEEANGPCSKAEEMRLNE